MFSQLKIFYKKYPKEIFLLKLLTFNLLLFEFIRRRWIMVFSDVYVSIFIIWSCMSICSHQHHLCIGHLQSSRLCQSGKMIALNYKLYLVLFPMLTLYFTSHFDQTLPTNVKCTMSVVSVWERYLEWVSSCTLKDFPSLHIISITRAGKCIFKGEQITHGLSGRYDWKN